MKHFPKITDENSKELRIREEYWVKQICPYNLYDLNISCGAERVLNLLWYESMGGKDSVLTTVTELAKICKVSRNTIRDSLQSLSDLKIISYHDFGNGAEKQRAINFLCPLPNQKSDEALAKIKTDIYDKIPIPKEPKESKSQGNMQQKSEVFIDPTKCVYQGYQL